MRHIACGALAAVLLLFGTGEFAVSQVTFGLLGQDAPTVDQTVPQDERPVRLRLTWGGGEPRQWQGRISPEAGSLSDLQIADLNADSPGSVWSSEGCVDIGSLSPRTVESIEVSATSQVGMLAIELTAGGDAAPLQARVSVADVLRGPVLLKLDEVGNTLRVERAPEDALQVHTEKSPLVFHPGEEFSFTIEPSLPEAIRGTTLDFEITLSRVGDREALWRDEPRLEIPVEGVPAQAVNLAMPSAEGVYAIRISARRPPGFGKRFLPGAVATLAERTIQVVVLDSQAGGAMPAGDWRNVLEIDPANPRWWERLPTWTQLRRIPGLNRGPLGSVRAAVIEHPLGRFIELPATAPGGEPHWQAYSLPLEAIGVPHILEIEYPSDQEQHLGLSIIEPNDAGAVEGITRDSGVYVEGLGRSETKTTSIHRLVFWPRTQAPLLMLANYHPTNTARFGHIRVLKCGSDHLPAVPISASVQDRMVAAYISSPMLLESLGISDKHSTAQLFHQPFELVGNDWHSCYTSTRRLSDYLRYAGYNCAVLSLGDGPRRIKHRSGRQSFDVHDADELELMLRVFDVEQLSILPSLEFARPLPELEAIRRASNPQTSGLEWIGPDGRTWLETYGANAGRAPYYNVLDVRVQQAVLGRVSDLLANYADHPSLAGIAVPLSSDGYTQLPPLEWGLDDATISRFERDTGVQIGGGGPDRFRARYALILEQHADAWRSWRAARLTEFYEQLAGVVRQTSAERRLLLTTEESLDHPSLAVRIRPNLLAENRVRTTLLDAGIHQEWLPQVPGIVLCSTKFVGPTAPLRDRAAEFEINEAFAESARGREPSTESAALLFHRPKQRRLASLAVRSPFRLAGDSALVCQPLAHGLAVRQSYVDALSHNDFTVWLDGGELLPMGQEETLRDLRLVLQHLPAKAEVAQLDQQPIVVRSFVEPAGTTLLVMNTCPWHTDATVTLSASQAVAMERLVEGPDEKDFASLSVLPGRFPWKLALEPYGVEAVRFTRGAVQVVEVQAAVSAVAKEDLANRISELTQRDTNAPRTYDRLVNPGFELIAANGRLAGWSVVGEPGIAQAELDGRAPRQGKMCGHLVSRGPFAALESDAFPVPPTGQLAMTVFLRGGKVDSRSEVRVVVEAGHSGRPYRRAVSIGTLPTSTYPLTTEWRPYPLLVNDLPLASDAMMRVRFEMTGAGEVWIDEIVNYDLLFSLPFYKYQQAESLRLVKLKQAAHSSQEAGRITDCLRLLESYWPRFVMTYAPVVERPSGEETPRKQIATSPALPADPKQEPSPGIGQRIKGFFKWR